MTVNEGHSDGRRRRSRRHHLAVLLVGVLVPACSSDGGSSHPPATDEAAPAAIQEVLTEIDAVWEQLSGRPSVVDDPDNEAMKRLRGLHTPDGPALSGGVEWLEVFAEEGQLQRTPPGRPYQQTVVASLDAIGADTADLRVCRILEVEVVDTEGEVLRPYEGPLVFVGEAEVRRLDGSWRLHRFRGQQSMMLDREDGEPVAWSSTTLDVECDLGAFDLPGG